jgi:hypothetical protein
LASYPPARAMRAYLSALPFDGCPVVAAGQDLGVVGVGDAVVVQGVDGGVELLDRPSSRWSR